MRSVTVWLFHVFWLVPMKLGCVGGAAFAAAHCVCAARVVADRQTGATTQQCRQLRSPTGECASPIAMVRQRMRHPRATYLPARTRALPWASGVGLAVRMEMGMVKGHAGVADW